MALTALLYSKNTWPELHEGQLRDTEYEAPKSTALIVATMARDMGIEASL